MARKTRKIRELEDERDAAKSDTERSLIEDDIKRQERKEKKEREREDRRQQRRDREHRRQNR